MKIVLLNAPHKSMKVEPLGLEYLVTFLRKNGIDASLIDASIENLSESTLFYKLKSLNPDIIGFTLTTPGLCFDINGIRIAKKACPNARIVVGGPHASAEPQSLMMHVREIDYCIIGEGELTLLELIIALKNKTSLTKIKGLAYRKKERIIINPRRELIKDLNILPLPSREFIDLRKIRANIPFGRKKYFSIIMSSRGCLYHCIYCSKSVFGNTYRFRTPENVISEIEYLISLGVKEVRFYDDIFTLLPERTKDICKLMIKNKYDLIWSCESRVDTINCDLLKLMKKAGCYHISYGIESGSQRILNLAKKGITVEQIKTAFKLTRSANLESSAWIMFGLPGENKDTIIETLRLVKEIDADYIAAGAAGLCPNTELYKISKMNIDWYAPRNEKASIFVDGNWIRYVGSKISKAEINRLLKKIYLNYYLNPKRWFRIIKNVNNSKMIVNSIKNVFN